MKISDTIKIKLWLKRYSFAELECLKKFVDDEYKKRQKDLLRHK